MPSPPPASLDIVSLLICSMIQYQPYLPLWQAVPRLPQFGGRQKTLAASPTTEAHGGARLLFQNQARELKEIQLHTPDTPTLRHSHSVTTST